MKLDTVPDLTMRGQEDPRGAATTPQRPMTVGQLAAHVTELAARPRDWWHLVRLDPMGPQHVRLAGVGADAAPQAEVWLVTWPPGYRTDVHDHEGPAASTAVSMVIAGELAEVKIAADGVAERPLRANRVQVHGGDRTHQLANPGPAYAVTLHARPSI